MICMNRCANDVTPMLKSLLHHRQSPIYFHLIVDDKSGSTFHKLFETWDLPDVKYTFYNGESYISSLDWIPDTHYSGKYSIMKILIPDILPTLKKVIILDTDTIILTDIAELWALFKNMTDNQFLGLSEAQSNWYLESVGQRWPALGRGYNAGVMLLNLEKIRNNGNWTFMWSEVVHKNIDKLKTLQLAEQDLINAVIKKYPTIVFTISCLYNVQLSAKSRAKYCYEMDIKKVKVIHWSSPQKYKINVTDSGYFRNIRQLYDVNFGGHLLRRNMDKC